MATNYVLGPTYSTIQVLSPTLTQPVVNCPITTKPSGVRMEYWIDETTWNAGNGPALLENVAAGVEHIMSSQPVISAVGSQQLDASGLISQWVTFTVAYPVPGSTLGPATLDVDVPVGDFGQDAFAGENFGLTDAENRIQTGYNQLAALAAG